MGRPVIGDVALAAASAACLFAVLIMATGGVLISWLTAIVAFVLFGMVNYLFWGHRLLKSVAGERRRAMSQARLVRASNVSADEFILELNDAERAELMRTLEQSLADAPPAVGAIPGAANEREAIRGVLDKLRGYGA
jgi:hypothetical protein